MDIGYDSILNAHVTRDGDRKVRHIRHSGGYWYSEESTPRLAANVYLQEQAGLLDIAPEQLERLETRVDFYNPGDLGVEYRLDEVKPLFDSITVGYFQTYLNLPVWRRGITIKVKQAPSRVVALTDNSEVELKGQLPRDDAVVKFRQMLGSGKDEGDGAGFLRELIANGGDGLRGEVTELLAGKLYVYKYDPEKRFAGKPEPMRPDGKIRSLEETAQPPFPQLPDVSGEIEPGRAYVVAEMIFRYDTPEYGELVWLVLVEVETASVLYIECMTCGVNGLVFRRDPNVFSGDLTVTSAATDAVLQNHDSDEILNALSGPVGGTQSLTGAFVTIAEVEDPVVAPPTQPTGVDFDYQPRTNDFAAVNAYYHQTELFRTIESLGFPIATYFDGTMFPIRVDHRGMGNAINAHWSPNGVGGTGHMCYALCDTTNTAQPLGRAVDPWVHWHEMGGHGTLGDHVGSGVLGFSHSAGDGLAALQMDPESALRGVPERFRYAPFRPFIEERRFDRDTTAWAWGSANDDGGYGSEQILATCHFRVYRSIGGDHADAGRRRFASRTTTYLILRTIGGLTAATNPNDPDLWADEMQDADLSDWTSEGLSGGAYNKVVRWAFEKQGAYGGTPPAVDVYIDDGRGGEYPFQPVHWHNTSMWNRNSADGLPGHQNAIEGATNYMYVKVKNRGTTDATNVNVKGYHCLPGAGLTWPNDFTVMTPATGLNVANIAANNGAEISVGPFEWIPNYNAYGHDCVLMIVSTPGDPSNVDHFTGAETIAEWRLVPNDNNVGQRNVSIVPGGGESKALSAAMENVTFWAGNSFNRRMKMHLQVRMPRFLEVRGWGIDLADSQTFVLDPGKKLAVPVKLVHGDDFSAADIADDKDRDIDIDLYAGDIILGGMKFRIDPELREPTGGKNPLREKCNDGAKALLECLRGETAGVSGIGLREVSGTRVSLDIELDREG